MKKSRAATRYVCLRLWCAVALLCGVVTLGAQNPDDLLASVVKITTPERQGSGVVVAIERGSAVVLTVYHVIKDVERYDVVFAGAPGLGPFAVAARDRVGWQSGDERYGLAAFRVRGAIPAAVRPARLEATLALQRGDQLVYWGFPNRSPTVRRLTMSVSALEGTNFVMDRPLGEGASGGPIVKDGKVVGIAAASDPIASYGVTSRVAAIALEGWPITLAPEPSVPPPATSGRGATPPPGPTGTTDIKLQFATDALFNQYGCGLQVRVNIGGASANPTSSPYTFRNVPLGRQDYHLTGQIACTSIPNPPHCMVEGRGTIIVDKGDTYGLQLSPFDPFDPRKPPCQVALVKQ